VAIIRMIVVLHPFRAAGTMIQDFPTWRDELIFTSDIVQDDDGSVTPEEAEAVPALRRAGGDGRGR
jgi:hypothetical protein